MAGLCPVLHSACRRMAGTQASVRISGRISGLGMAIDTATVTEERGTLVEVAKTFLRLGFVAYGGPAAHVAMMEEEFVRRRGWLTRERFLDLVGAVSLLPGPSSTELAIYLGELR